MAEETPGAAVFTAAEVDAVADSTVSPTTRKQMLATLAGLSARLVTELSGALHMHAAIEDELLALWAMVRVLTTVNTSDTTTCPKVTSNRNHKHTTSVTTGHDMCR